jgi:hypothetical protein
VQSDGTISQQVNVTHVGQLGTGVYCVNLNGIDPTKVAAVASVFQGSGAREVASTAPGSCANPVFGLGIQVNIWNTVSNAVANDAFSIVVP